MSDRAIELLAEAHRCATVDCDGPRYCRGFCVKHYARWRKNGSTDLPTTEDRFWSKVDKTPTCWLWTAGTTTEGYGTFSIGGRANRKTHYTHRFAYELFVGPVPDGLELDHLCRVRQCCNPEHLEPVTGAENKRRAGAAQTHCSRGHEWTPETTYRNGPKGENRGCLVCRRERDRDRQRQRQPRVRA